MAYRGDLKTCDNRCWMVTQRAIASSSRLYVAVNVPQHGMPETECWDASILSSVLPCIKHSHPVAAGPLHNSLRGPLPLVWAARLQPLDMHSALKPHRQGVQAACRTQQQGRLCECGSGQQAQRAVISSRFEAWRGCKRASACCTPVPVG